jgi:hypothetical protein
MPPEAWLLAIIGGLVTAMLGMLTWLFRAIGTGTLRTNREYQEQVEEKVWYRQAYETVSNDYRELSTEHAATTAHVLSDLRKAAKVKEPE